MHINLKDGLLRAKDTNGLTASDIAAFSANKEIFVTLWRWGREEEVNLKDGLLLAKGHNGLTAWYFAAWHVKKEILEHCDVGVGKCK